MSKFILFIFIFVSVYVVSEENHFEEAIQEFEKQDIKNFPPKNATLFIGSSSIRLWKTLEEDFPEIDVINRGFGGSQTSDAIYFFERIVSLYQPQTIVFYCGENDIAGGKPTSAPVQDFQTFFKLVQETLPDTTVYYISMKPSPSREHLQEQMTEANNKIKSFCEQQQLQQQPLFYIDVVSQMLDENGKALKEIFIEDMLHMNEKGYQIWKEIVRDELGKHKLLENAE